MLAFRFYLPGASTPFWEKRYRGSTIIPPIPRKDEKVVLENKIYVVVETPTHYFESVHELGFVVQEALGNEEGDPEEKSKPKKAAPSKSDVYVASYPPQKSKVKICKYCRDEECPGGEDCNFYDGTLE